MTLLHGLKFNEPVTGARPLTEKSNAIVGLVATAGPASPALDAAFPLNKPVLVTDVRSAIGAAGTEGTLAKALAAIADQGSPVTVVVRVAAGANPADTATNVIGATTDGVYTGLQALLMAEAKLHVRPRILGCPGLDGQAVVNAMIVVAKRLRGFCYAACRPDGVLATNVGDAADYRGEFGDRELMLIWPDWTAWDGYAVASALGLRAAIDEAEGWHRSISNVAVVGPTSISKDVLFDLLNSSTDAGVLNEAPVTTLVRLNGYAQIIGDYRDADPLAPEPELIARCALRFGVTERHVEQRLRLADLADEVLSALRDGRLNARSAEA